ncbi:hypothetical protein B9Z19DRAFT_791085 [Tuber borchii]|uniref:Uncharacterized protein n=1 Tax=Tuber borchii TaxID=42251 RepID=A0A2T6ZWC1_TUBBO|nr:hypothetical protein B9Z19DRAFT_791085 [Tuber borchii]
MIMTEMVGVKKKASRPLEPLPTSSAGFTATASLCEIGGFPSLPRNSFCDDDSEWLAGLGLGGGRGISMETAAAEIDSRHVRRPTVSLLSRSAYLKEASPNPTQACIFHTPPHSLSSLFLQKPSLTFRPTDSAVLTRTFFFSSSLSASSLGPCALPFNGFSPQHLNLEGQSFSANP